MKRVAILQSNYIPWKGYFGLIDKVDEFILLDEVQFTKNDWRNRNRIKTRAGVQWMSIPVRHEHLEQKISEVRVSDNRWSTRHWNTLAQNYARAQYFRRYAALVEEIYREAGTLERLSDVNRLFIGKLCALFALKTKITPCTDYRMEGDRVERLVNICRQAQARVYVSGPAAKEYLDEGKFAAQGIAVEWMNYAGYPEYDQLFLPFEHSVTILDLLFNAGADNKAYIRTS